jgi:hypothetical protein
MEYELDHRLALARGFSRLPWRASPLCNVLWWIIDTRSEMQVTAIQDAYRTSRSAGPNYTVEGPGWTFATRRDLYRHLVALWKNSSIQLRNLCDANGIRYYHFLQPNLFLSGAKPLTPEEAQMKAFRDDMYRPGVREGYPLLIREGEDLKAHGERFVDLTRVFDGHAERIYNDICHVNQAGDHLFADHVARAILEGLGDTR